MFQSDCHKKGGYIAEINSKAENDYLKQHLLGNIFTYQILWGKSGPEVIKLFPLNSAEHEIYPAHKCQNVNNCWHFNIYEHDKYNI